MNKFYLFMLCSTLILDKVIESSNGSMFSTISNIEQEENITFINESMDTSVTKSQIINKYLLNLTINSVTENSVVFSFNRNNIENNYKNNLSVLPLIETQSNSIKYSRSIDNTSVKVEGLIPGAKYIARLEIYGKQTEPFQLVKKFVTKPTGQQNLTLIERDYTFMRLNWIKNEGFFDEYLIKWSRKQCYDSNKRCPDVDFNQRLVSKNATNFKLTGLHPVALYKIQLYRTSTIDQMREYSKRYLDLINTIPYPPTSISVEKDSIGTRSFLIYWDKPNRSCEFSGYNLGYRDVDSNILYLVDDISLNDINLRNFSLSKSIEPGKTYDVYVTTVNKIDYYSEYVTSDSVTIQVTTHPLPVENVRANALSDSEILLEWTSHIESNQDYYLVKYYTKYDSGNSLNQTFEKPPITLTKLLLDHIYVIEVFAVSKDVFSEKEWTSISLKNHGSSPGFNPEQIYLLIILLIIAISIILIIYFVSIKFHKRKTSINPLYGTSQDEDGVLLKFKQDKCSFIDEDLKIRYENLAIKQKILGKGQFGTVKFGHISLTAGQKTFEEYNIPVAIKMPNKNTDKEEIKSLLKEALIMKGFKHTNVMSIIGISVSSDGNLYIVLPFMQNGDLLTYLKANKNGITSENFFRFSLGAVKGMEYLAENNFVHRDLAARNCMLDDNLNVKIADFGLSKHLTTSDYYRSNSKYLPIRWMAIESISKRIFTTKSDVWSYGILVWEIFMFGAKPYENLQSNNEVMDYIKKGKRLLKPPECPQNIYDMLRFDCWSVNPEKRPTFSNLRQKLKGLNINKNTDSEPSIDTDILTNPRSSYQDIS